MQAYVNYFVIVYRYRFPERAYFFRTSSTQVRFMKHNVSQRHHISNWHNILYMM